MASPKEKELAKEERGTGSSPIKPAAAKTRGKEIKTLKQQMEELKKPAGGGGKGNQNGKAAPPQPPQPLQGAQQNHQHANLGTMTRGDGTIVPI